MKPFRADSSFARVCDLQPASCMNVAHSVDELVSHLPLKEHQTDSSLEKQNLGCPLGQHNVQGDVSVQTRETKGSFHQGVSKDNQAEKIKHDPLGQNVSQNSSAVHQDIKTNQMGRGGDLAATSVTPLIARADSAVDVVA
ncbi:UNVERIFIED_CONTAM: hypothetical protein K2H54_064656 [Gekko kuhli]